MAFPPQVFFIGAEKCGTTMICDLIGQHPRIDLSTPRDADYLTRNLAKGESWYRDLFSPGDQVISIDVSLSYASAPVINPKGRSEPELERLWGVPERIWTINPDAKFIYSVRDPVSRTYSSYWHARRFNYENRPFREAIEEQPLYLSVSDYAAQLELYLEKFPPKAFHFIRFDDLKRDPVSTARHCLAFLGADDEPVDIAFEKPKNESFQYNKSGQLLQRMSGSGGRTEALLRSVKRVVPKSLIPKLKKLVTNDVPRIEDTDRQYLLSYFSEKISRFAGLSGLDLSDWAAGRH